MMVKRAIIVFAKRHSATGRAHDSQLGLEVRILGQRFFQRPDHHVSYAVQALWVPLSWLASKGRPEFGPPSCSGSSTENRLTGVMQSRPVRNDSSVSSKPKPSGLTIPAATTATRAVSRFDVKFSHLGTCPASIPFAFGEGLESRRNENGSSGSGGLSVEFIQWRFEIR